MSNNKRFAVNVVAATVFAVPTGAAASIAQGLHGVQQATQSITSVEHVRGAHGGRVVDQ